MDKMVEYLCHTQLYKNNGSRSTNGLVVYADDQFINRKLIQVQFKELECEGSLIDFTNGQEVVDYFA